MASGLYGLNMENVALLVEKDTNTEQENVLERNTVEKIVLEITKKQLTARLMCTAQVNHYYKKYFSYDTCFDIYLYGTL